MKGISRMLDISESYYSLIEGGNRKAKMDISLATKISAALKIPINKVIANEADQSK